MTDTTGTPARKRLLIRTWGCQMNVYDSARMADVLAPLGYAPTETPEEADMVILNTCHIREKATEKVFSDLGRLREAKQARGGGMGHRGRRLRRPGRGAEITARAPWVDIVLGPQILPPPAGDGGPRLPRRRGAVIETDFPAEDKFDHLPETAAPQGPSPSSRCRKAATSSAPSASCPTRAGRSIRARSRRSSRRRAAGGAGRARDHAARPERERLSRRGAGRRRPGARPAGAASWRRSRAWRASATPPPIRATWMTT
jgi:hypothetical protein